MAAREEARDLEVGHGAFLTDGCGLYRVMDVQREPGRVWLEDCAAPGLPAVEWSVRALLAAEMRVVEPSGGDDPAPSGD